MVHFDFAVSIKDAKIILKNIKRIKSKKIKREIRENAYELKQGIYGVWEHSGKLLKEENQ